MHEGPMTTPKAHTHTSGAPTSTSIGPTDKKTSKPEQTSMKVSETTESAMVKRFAEFLKQQNKARRMDSAEKEKLIR